MTVAPDRRAATVSLGEWGDKPLYGTVISFDRPCAQGTKGWTKEGEFTLIGPAGTFYVTPGNNDVELPEAPAWTLTLYSRGHGTQAENGDYYLTVWPQPPA